MRGKPTARAFVLAVISGDVKKVRDMKSRGVSVAEPDQYGWLPIHRAAANDRDEIIRLLIQWGSPIETTGTNDWTPLHLASVSCSPRAVTALLEAGANIRARSSFGATPLHLAIGKTVTEELLRTVRLLIGAGAEIDIEDEKGQTPLDRAKETGNAEVLSLLMDETD